MVQCDLTIAEIEQRIAVLNGMVDRHRTIAAHAAAQAKAHEKRADEIAADSLRYGDILRLKLASQKEDNNER